ncbi:hypothetical protein H696_00964 [Fonticula alba]|uniref:Uncharacterized protein n=1 Tax=Fonticula alba TaxID=691883 RepID=A0A058ZIT4_FONAL|nr:hypothetical protein H696_00964 [Fonticula alba]KCV73427.1 hypothetical protein H696_00964 [Fonticula alba]|eukprot:XP_009493128.1 hypothetical protein H696_00964 [Fonticula alba]
MRRSQLASFLVLLLLAVATTGVSALGGCSAADQENRDNKYKKKCDTADAACGSTCSRLVYDKNNCISSSTCNTAMSVLVLACRLHNPKSHAANIQIGKGSYNCNSAGSLFNQPAALATGALAVLLALVSSYAL